MAKQDKMRNMADKSPKAKIGRTPNQDYRGHVKRHLEAGGDPKYVNVRKKARARREGGM